MLKPAIALLIFYMCFSPFQVWAQSELVLPKWKTEKARQFDFWIGQWDVNLRMIQKDNTWKDSVQAKADIHSILDGKAILELWDSPTIKGFSLRYFDPDSKKWILYLNWPNNSRSNIGSLAGEFRHGRGQFFTTNRQADGKQSISRYTFCDISPNSLRWDDAYSKDGGKTWTNNWIMEFNRTADAAHWPTHSFAAHTFKKGGRCKGPEFDAVNSIAGNWQGELEILEGATRRKVPAELSVYQILDGCTVIRFLEFSNGGETYRNFGLLTFNQARQVFEELSLDNRVGTKASLLRGRSENGMLSLVSRQEHEGQELRFRHQWQLPTATNDRLVLEISSSIDGKKWDGKFSADFQKQSTTRYEDEHPLKNRPILHQQAINAICPRSGKRVAEDSLTSYRGHTVGFCNTDCRDDFAANIEHRKEDRLFFDRIIDARK